MTDASAAPTTTPPRPCNRCKDKPAVHDLRSAEKVCPGCFAAFVAQKNMKRIEVMQRETRDARARPPGAGAAAGRGPPPPQRYLLALSGGPASVALLHLLAANLAQQRRAKGGRQRPRFELFVVHVDTEGDWGAGGAEAGEEERDQERGGGGGGGGDEDAAAAAAAVRDPLLDPYRARFPDLTFLRVPLADALTLRTVDWAALFPNAPAAAAAEEEAEAASSGPRRRAARLAHLLTHGLATPSSRADVRRLLVRHVLLATAASARARCDVVLLGCTTTALAERALAETAKGRGFALPWLVNDGAAPVPASLSSEESEEKKTQDAPPAATIPVYSPLRELLRAEIATYHTTLDPPLTDLFFGADHVPSSSSSSTTTTAAAPAPAVVSHKDLSIDDVMRRYFADVERAYPSVVANVVRTTDKLVRDDGDGGGGGGAARLCGLCGVGRDEAGDARWRGELGESGRPAGAETAPARRLCYGCERSVYG